MDAIRGVRAGAEWGESEQERETRRGRLRRAMARVHPLTTPAGVRLGYMVDGTHGHPLPHGPYREATQAIEAALQSQEKQSQAQRERWARRKEQ